MLTVTGTSLIDTFSGHTIYQLESLLIAEFRFLFSPKGHWKPTNLKRIMFHVNKWYESWGFPNKGGSQQHSQSSKAISLLSVLLRDLCLKCEILSTYAEDHILFIHLHIMFYCYYSKYPIPGFPDTFNQYCDKTFFFEKHHPMWKWQYFKTHTFKCFTKPPTPYWMVSLSHKSLSLWMSDCSATTEKGTLALSDCLVDPKWQARKPQYIYLFFSLAFLNFIYGQK